MCGIAGVISADPRIISKAGLKKMTDEIAYRGPDGGEQWVSENGKVGLGHRRLSIIDLSHNADQPMHYLDRYTIVFNGEIYNYIELKATLQQQGFTFNTASDTEVLMALYHRDKEKCLQLLDGMFAFAIYDKQEQIVFCARDRFGEKPFFYSYQPGKHFIFGSEMKVLWQAGVEKKVNNRMLYAYLQNGILGNPEDLQETFYEGCSRLPHSCYMKIDVQALTAVTTSYYDIDWQQQNSGISEEAAAAQLQHLFYESVKRRLRSDVPVGSSLSGGLDSSLVVAVIDELIAGSSQVQKTFSAVFPGFEKDERKFMDMVIEKTKVSPYFVTPTDEGMINELDRIAYHQEEPFGSASIYVQYKVMELAKSEQVTVLLDGQGADEILAGYHGYYLQFFKGLYKQDKSRYHRELESYKNLHSANSINGIMQRGAKQRVKEMLPFAVKPLKSIYRALKPDPRLGFFTDDFRSAYRKASMFQFKEAGSLNEALYNSTMKGGLQELLRYADRNSMAHSREVRLPFLSHEVVEFLFSLPAHFKIRDGWTKWIMRQTFKAQLPEAIAWRKDKIGYEPPQKSWMENARFKDMVSDARKTLVTEGILKKEFLSKDVKPEAANTIKENTWGQLMAAGLFK